MNYQATIRSTSSYSTTHQAATSSDAWDQAYDVVQDTPVVDDVDQCGFFFDEVDDIDDCVIFNVAQ